MGYLGIICEWKLHFCTRYRSAKESCELPESFTLYVLRADRTTALINRAYRCFIHASLCLSEFTRLEVP